MCHSSRSQQVHDKSKYTTVNNLHYPRTSEEDNLVCKERQKATQTETPEEIESDAKKTEKSKQNAYLLIVSQH